jgi:hypothetical protein
MDAEIYFKLAVLGTILIVALVYPVVSALALTAVAAWHIQEFRIGEVALVQKVVELTPPGIKAIVASSSLKAWPHGQRRSLNSQDIWT